MNHLLKFVQFYKMVKESDVLAIDKLIKESNVNFPLKQIKYNEFIFNCLPNFKENETCPFCLENLYKIKNPLITIELNNEYYFLKIKENQILNQHFEISNLRHTDALFDINHFKFLLEIFPSFMVIYSRSNHTHYDLGLIDSPISNKDATQYFNNVYLVDWHLETYLIKEKDFDDLIDEYENLNKKISIKNKTYFSFKRGNKYYLYIIIHNENVTSFEALGIFNFENKYNSLSNLYNDGLNKISQSKKTSPNN